MVTVKSSMGAVIVALAGCRGLLGIDDPSIQVDASQAVDSAPPPDVAVGTTYRANAVRFDGASYLSRIGLENTARSSQGTFSVWLRFQGGDGQQQLVTAAQIIGIGGVVRQSSDQFELLMQTCTGVVLLDLTSVGTYTTQSGWIHLLAAWDTTAGKAQLYINDIADAAPNPTVKSGSICYDTPAWGIGGLSSGSLDADVADLYTALGTFIDLDVPANRRRFSTAAGKPISLGGHCTTPLGSVPTGCFVGDATGWSTNAGVAGPFTNNNDVLANAPTSPSD